MSQDAALPCAEAPVPVDALPVDLDYITEELKIRAKSELFENDETKVQSLQLLRSMLKEEQNLRWQDDDLFLLAFLRARKFDVKRAFKLIKGLYANFGKHSQVYYNLSFDRLKIIMEQSVIHFLPYRDKESSAILCYRCKAWDPDVVTAEELLVCSSLGFLQALLSPSTQISGFQVIIDYEDFSLRQLMHVRPSNAWFFAEMIQNAVPIRVRGIHMVNQNRIFSYAWALFKHFLSKKLVGRVHMHGDDFKSLHKFFHPSILPADFGGELPFDTTDWRERMEASADYINHLLSFGYEKYLTKEKRHQEKDDTENLN